MAFQSKSQAELARAVWRDMFGVLMQTNPVRQASLSRRGLTPNDSRALHTLDREEGQPIGVLAKLWQCDPSTATWVVDRLEKAGLAERRPSPSDRRVKLVALTEKGEAMSKEIMAEFHEPPDMLARLDEGELATLRELMERLKDQPA